MTRGPVRTISVLDADPDLTRHLDPADLVRARAHAVASAVILRPGECDPWEWIDSPDGHLGLLIVDGILARQVTLLGRTSVELVGAEDLLRPWDNAETHLSVPQTVTWTVHRRALVAALDRRFVERVAPWPAIATALVDRALSRAQWLAVHLAILENPRVDVRLLLLMWYLADRWGKVEPQGVAVPLKLTHTVLGRLVRAHRPTVTARLNELAEQRLLTRLADGGWMLHGEPGDQMRRLAVD
jgi:CRP/FNR family transcriptional regulator, cyclic AMP receptor protein